MSSEQRHETSGCEEARGAAAATLRHTWEEGDQRATQGRGGGEEEQEEREEREEQEEEEEEQEEQEEQEEDGCGRDAAGGTFCSDDGAVGGSSCKATHSNCSSETCIPTPSCRICFQGAEQGDLLNPCRCDGSVRYTHQHCLLKWISERGAWTCELCCYRFNIRAINMKRPWQWQPISITLVEKVQIIAVFLGSVFLVSSLSWLLWSALSPQAVWQRRDVLFQVCYGMYGFMDLVCVGLIVHEGAAVFNVFLRWRAVNLHWDVQSYDKAKDMEDAGHAPLAGRTLWLPLVTLGPTQLGRRPWSCLCPGLLPRDQLSRDESGEVVIRVTSV